MTVVALFQAGASRHRGILSLINWRHLGATVGRLTTLRGRQPFCQIQYTQSKRPVGPRGCEFRMYRAYGDRGFGHEASPVCDLLFTGVEC